MSRTNARVSAPGWPRGPTRRVRRGVVLLLVVIVVTLAALTGGAVALAASTERAATSAGRAVTQARLAALSGVQAAMAELADQRESLLVGEPPEVTERWTLATLADGSRLEVRLLPLDSSPDAPASGLLIAESARLDINSATRPMLEDLGIDAALAQRIIAARTASPFSSVTDLLRVEGVTPEMLGRATLATMAAADETAPAPDTAASDAAALAPPDLASLLTVFAFDPNIQAGLAEDGEQFRGRLRVNLDQPWSDRLRRALVERFDEDAAAGVERIMREGTTFATDADIIKTLRRLTLPPESWGEILDVFTTTDDEYLLGRVDLRTASEAVLAALPGISPQQAREIVAARERLAPDAMLSSAWIVTEGLLTPNEFEQVVDHLTTRCLQWRLRIEAGIVRPDPSAAGIGGLDPSASGDADAPLTPRVVLEAVIDVASQRPRIAYLRDITLLEPAASLLDDPTLAEDLGLDTGERDAFILDADPTDLLAPTPDTDDSEPDQADSPAARGPRSSPDPWDALGGDPRDEEASPNPRDGADEPLEPDPDRAPAPENSEFKDRRIGRWTAGSGPMMRGRAQGGAP